ncbi:hypothetical protein C5167_019902 [Papaver somniferum]|uniref:Uncharacterized protein n=1 Tax=Papaver somniferum TaxID=3469 RepID=A0A4Y7IUL7_PAPSO|nr:hypothetical protein C5167_019902 [Papaver somniferum]
MKMTTLYERYSISSFWLQVNCIDRVLLLESEKLQDEEEILQGSINQITMDLNNKHQYYVNPRRGNIRNITGFDQSNNNGSIQ